MTISWASTVSGAFYAIAILAAALIHPNGAAAQTVVDVHTNARASQVSAVPECGFPCDVEVDLPVFARTLALVGPEGFYRTNLTRSAFRRQLEDWRRFMEKYRRSIELRLRRADDRHEGLVTYLVDGGVYDQFREAYRSAVSLERNGKIVYGTDAPKS